MPPGALASAVSSVIALVEDAPCRLTALITTLRMYGNVQPVSSYGLGLAGA